MIVIPAKNNQIPKQKHNDIDSDDKVQSYIGTSLYEYQAENFSNCSAKQNADVNYH